MIQPNELRIGNFIYDKDGNVIQVLALSYEVIKVLDKNSVLYIDANPIPLTPEILEKAGFEYEDMGDDSPYERWVCKEYRELWFWHFNNEEWMFCLGDGFEQGDYQYLHQLQNLYFALTQTELNIKQ